MSQGFHINRFMDGSGKVDLSDIDWSDVPKHKLTPEAIRTLTYFLKTEGSTFFYVKALMKTKACIEEPELAPFLCVWMYEEEFHGRAFRKFLEAYGVDVPESYRADMFSRRSIGEKVDELGQVALARIFPDEWPAVHMTWGVIQEYTTYCAYQALIERVNHPILSVICQRIMKQELKHYAFYKEHARKRLINNPRAQRVTTYALKLAWTPVGDGMCEKDESVFVIQHLFDGLDGDACRKIDEKTRELPGLEWFDLFTKFARDHKIGKAPTSWLSEPATLEASEGAIAAE